MAKYIGNPAVTNNVFTTDANFVFVTVIDSANEVVIGQVTYNSDNRVTLDFDGSFSGKAFFN